MAMTATMIVAEATISGSKHAHQHGEHEEVHQLTAVLSALKPLNQVFIPKLKSKMLMWWSVNNVSSKPNTHSRTHSMSTNDEQICLIVVIQQLLSHSWISAVYINWTRHQRHTDSRIPISSLQLKSQHDGKFVLSFTCQLTVWMFISSFTISTLNLWLF